MKQKGTEKDRIVGKNVIEGWRTDGNRRRRTENVQEQILRNNKDKNFGIERKDETKISKKKDLRKLHTYLQTLTREEKEELFALQHPVDKEEKAVRWLH